MDLLPVNPWVFRTRQMLVRLPVAPSITSIHTASVEVVGVATSRHVSQVLQELVAGALPAQTAAVDTAFVSTTMSLITTLQGILFCRLATKLTSTHGETFGRRTSSKAAGATVDGEEMIVVCDSVREEMTLRRSVQTI